MMVLFAFLLYFKEAYWLISGINFSPRETVRERYDLPGLTRHMGKMCALIGLVLLISGIGAFAGLEMFFVMPIGLVFIIVPVFLFGTERYMYTGRKAQRIINIAITGFMAVVLVFVIIMLTVGAKPPAIEIDQENITIKSMYGIEIPFDSIERVEMVSLEGKNIIKLNGFDLGDNLKGEFKVQGLGAVTIYQQGKPCNSVLIRASDQIYLINMGSEAENTVLKSQIISAMERQ